MRLWKLIKRFCFLEEYRAKITLGTDVRLNPQTNRIQLQANDAGEYPTTADLYAKSWVTNPNTVKQWLNFQVFGTHVYDDLGAALTSLGFRLGDGTDEYYWDGGAWSISTSNWNTEAEIANNIPTFPVTEKKIQVIVNLVTTDKRYTPTVQEVRLLYSSDVEFQEDLLVRSLIPKLREEIQVIADYPLAALAAPSSTLDLDDYPLGTPYNIVGIDSVFNHTDDPDHFNDLFQSYDSGTHVITLSAPIDAGKVPWVRFLWTPEIAISTSQEYSELEKVPVIELIDIALTNKRMVGQDTGVLNKDTGTGTLLPGPRQTDIEISMRGVTDSGRDHQRLADEMRGFFFNNSVLVSKGMDEEYRLQLTIEYNDQTGPNQGGIHSGFLRFRIVGALFFQKQTKDVFAVERMVLTGDMDVTIG